MSKITLKQGIQRKVDAIELTNSQLDTLLDMQKTINGNQRYRRGPNFVKFVGVAAAITLVFTFGFFYMNQQIPMGEKIAFEVSKNHLKLKPLEIKTNQLDQLQKYFTLLDFKLVHTNILNDSKWKLLGARYCSIQGNTAAQLRLENIQTGEIETLYQAPYYTKQFSDIPILETNQFPLKEYAKGMSVKIWVEKGVLFALTSNSQSN